MTQMVPVRERVANVRTLLERSKGQIAMALPRHVTPERMLRVAMTCVQNNPRLLECTDVSLVGAIIKASQLGLEPDTLGARAYLIPRRNNRRGGVMEANFQPGYQGLMDLARRSKEIATFEAREVYQGDKFIYTYGLKPTLVHVPGGETDEAKITHVYAVTRLVNGQSQFEVMTRGQIDAHRVRYSKDSRDESAWKTSWTAMAKKTVIIRLCKYLPASVELQEAVALQERDDVGLPQDLGMIIDAAATVEDTGSAAGSVAPPSKLDQLTDQLQGQGNGAPKSEATGPTAATASSEIQQTAGTVDLGQPSLLDDPKPALLAQVEQLAKDKGVKAGRMVQLAEKYAGVSDYRHAEPGDLPKLIAALEAMKAEGK